MNLFLCSRVIDEAAGRRLLLDAEETHHAVRVLRHREGDSLHVTDGRGRLFRGELERISGEQAMVSVRHEAFHPKPSPDLHIAVGLIRKRDRMEFAVEKAVELGASGCLIFVAEHSEKRSCRLDRLRSTALAAMKQSLRPWVPEILFYDSLTDLLDKIPAGRTLLAADETAGQGHRKHTLPSDANPGDFGRREPGGGESDTSKTGEEPARAGSLLTVIGPEGGFSENERSKMREAGAATYSLGSYRLRTETAVVATAARFMRG